MARSVVQTKNGAVGGERGQKVCRFLGVPFAKPPVGPARFLPPEPVADWPGERPATVFGPVAMQAPTVLELERGLSAEMSEDCLTLNVWTPADPTPGRLLPVLVWIHGGSFLNGSGSMPWFDGSNLAGRGDVIAVTINYRLGVFGYLELGHIGGAAYEGSGNAGLLDQVAALAWIRDNIGAFGGDPERVCVVGESAGAMSIGTLLATPAASGLFQRAILQSGTPTSQPVQDARPLAAELFGCLGLSPDKGGLSTLLGLDAATILGAAGEVTNRIMAAAVQTGQRSAFMWSPVVDEAILPGEPRAAIGAGASSRVPVLIGTTRDEMRIVRRLFPDRPAVQPAQIEEYLLSLFGAHAAEARAAYESWNADATPEDIWDAIASDRIFTLPTSDFIDQRMATGAPTWTYLFNWRSAADGGRYGAAHTVEIPFVFDTFDAPGVADFLGRPAEETWGLSRGVQDAWVSFARDGFPSATGLPDWPPCTRQDRPTMVLDEDSRLVQDPLAEVRALWKRARA